MSDCLGHLLDCILNFSSFFLFVLHGHGRASILHLRDGHCPLSDPSVGCMPICLDSGSVLLLWRSPLVFDLKSVLFGLIGFHVFSMMHSAESHVHATQVRGVLRFVCLKSFSALLSVLLHSVLIYVGHFQSI